MTECKMLISKFNTKEDKIDVSKLEERINRKLPESYAKFLIKYNGGDTPNTNWNGKCKSDVRFFYGIGVEENGNDILESLKYEIVQNLLEKSFLPIAENCSGDFFCINLVDSKIYFSYHDKNRITLIAESFEEFISKIKSKKIGHIRTIEERRQLLLEKRGREPTAQQLKGWQDEIDEYSNINQEEVVL